MFSFRNNLLFVSTTLALSLPILASADASQISISPAGVFSAKNLVVIQKSGTNLFTRAVWGNPFIRITVLYNASTTITKNHGEAASIKDITEGEILDVDGMLSSGSDGIIIGASSVRDVSKVQESKTISGTVKSINASAQTLVVPNTVFGNTSVIVSPSIPIQKGARQIEFTDINVGDKIISASGTYDYPSNTLTVRSIEVFQEKSIFTPRNFQGSLKSLSATTLPATAVVTVGLPAQAGNTDYTVYLAQNSSVLKNNKSSATLARYVVGDTVRFYGAIRPTNLTEIDAEIIRDLNF